MCIVYSWSYSYGKDDKIKGVNMYTFIDIVQIVILFIIAAFCSFYTYKKTEKIYKFKGEENRIKKRVLNAIENVSVGKFLDSSETVDIGLGSKNSFTDSDFFKKIININKEKYEKIRIDLQKAGLRSDNSFERFLIVDVCCFGMLIGIGVFYLLKTNFNINIPFVIEAPISVIIGLILAFFIAESNLHEKAIKRQEIIDMGVPDLIDLLVICTDSGLDLHRSIMRVSRELHNSNIELSDEFMITAVEMEMIPDFRQVFKNLENRTDSQQVKSLSKTLSQSIEYGSSLADMLRDLAQEARQRKMLLAEEKAARIPTLLTLPLMLFILPCLFIVMLGPVVADVMKSFN